MSDFRCYYCKEDKLITEFYLVKGKHRPVSDFCKPCKRSIDKARYNKNKEKHKAQSAEWAKNNREKVNTAVRNSRIVTEHGNVIVHNNIGLDALYKRDEGICKLCNVLITREEATRDHILPLSRGGLHSWDNVQLACNPCNAKKGSKTMEEFNRYK